MAVLCCLVKIFSSLLFSDTDASVYDGGRVGVCAAGAVRAPGWGPFHGSQVQ